MSKLSKAQVTPGPDGQPVIPYKTKIKSVQFGIPRDVLNLGMLNRVAATQAILTLSDMMGVPGIRVTAPGLTYDEFIPLSSVTAVRVEKETE
jgi:hypothetical protein